MLVMIADTTGGFGLAGVKQYGTATKSIATAPTYQGRFTAAEPEPEYQPTQW